MDFGEFIGGIQTVDLLLVLYFMGFFVLGFAQGTIRRLIGIASILFSFLFAANLAEPLGEFLGANWTQFPKEYSYMIGFLTVFVAAALAFALVAQGWYKPQPLFEKARFVDELLGGLLGLVQAGTHPRLPRSSSSTRSSSIRGIVPDPQEIPFLRDLWDALESSQIVDVFQETLIPAFFVAHGLPRSRRRSRRRTALSLQTRRPRRASAGGPTPDGRADSCSARSSSATTRPVVASGGSSRSRRTAVRRTGVARPLRPDAHATRSCSGRPGIAYVYLVYGMYDCLNVVTGPRRRGQPRC